ncbi:MAG: HD domain-containing protein [Candidatus Saccharimonadales bacterium]
MRNLNVDTPLIKLAYDIAFEAHEATGAKYGDLPYIEHPIEVASLAQLLGYAPEVVAGCLLHDVLEDTVLRREDLSRLGIPPIVADGVEAVTWQNGIDTLNKVDKARSHPLGHVIKFCDSSRNFATTVNAPETLGSDRALSWAQDYAQKLGSLVIGLPAPRDIELFIEASRL